MRSDIAKMIREEPMFLHRAGWTYHPPVYDENGRFRFGFPEHDAFNELSLRFRKAGVRINLTNLPAGWVGDDEFDFRSMDETLEKLFAMVPDALYIPRIRLDSPFKWMENHPEEVCVFEEGPRDPAKIAELVRQGKVNNTYNMTLPAQANGLQPLRLDELIGLQSFSSKRWLRDACAALEKVMHHLMDGPYWKHFIGFHICFGGTCELLPWGNGGSRIGDFSIQHTLDFFDWAVKKYNGLENLRKVWEQPELCRDNAFVPPVAWRRQRPETLEDVYCRKGVKRFCADYALFHSESIVDAFLELAKTAKRIAPDLAVGAFYAYEGCGHDDLDRMLESPYVDYFSAPKPYGDPVPGGKGGSISPVASIMHQKVWVEELDNRTHHAWDPRKFQASINVEPATSLEETANVLWREVCKLEQDGANWWWMDQGDALHRWYDDDELMEVVADQVKVHRALCAAPARDLCQVITVRDDDHRLLGCPNGNSVRSSLRYSGILYHEYRMGDLDSLDLSGYKIMIFRNPGLLTRGKLQEIQSRMAPDARILFAELPGICAQEFNLTAAEEITGMKLSRVTEENGAPGLVIAEGAEETIARDQQGIRAARKGNYYLSLQPLTTDQLQEIIAASGVKKIIPAQGVVQGNSKLFGVFSTRDAGIDCTLPLPEKGDWYEWFTQKEYLNADTAPVAIGPKQARVFIRKEIRPER